MRARVSTTRFAPFDQVSVLIGDQMERLDVPCHREDFGSTDLSEQDLNNVNPPQALAVQPSSTDHRSDRTHPDPLRFVPSQPMSVLCSPRARVCPTSRHEAHDLSAVCTSPFLE